MILPWGGLVGHGQMGITDTLKESLGDLLPKFTEQEKKLIKGSCDFYAIDGYTAFYAKSLSPSFCFSCITNRTDPAWPECAPTSSSAPDGFGVGPAADNGASWLKSTPVGIRKFLNHITKELFPSVKEIMVSEFGFAEPFESECTNLQDAIWDLRRTDHLQWFLDNILLAIHEDEVNVTGAFTWSICEFNVSNLLTPLPEVERSGNVWLISDLTCLIDDSFEWSSGAKVRFGLQYLNYTSLERTPKASMFQYLDWFKNHCGEFIKS